MAAGGSIEEEINHSPVDTKTTVVGSQAVTTYKYLLVQVSLCDQKTFMSAAWLDQSQLRQLIIDESYTFNL